MIFHIILINIYHYNGGVQRQLCMEILIQSVTLEVSDPNPDPVKGFVTYLVVGSDDLGTF